MNNSFKKSIPGVLITCAMGSAPVATAQHQQLVLEEVRVTATHRDMAAQDVASSLSVLGDTQIESLRIRNAADLQNYVPGLTIKSQSIGTAKYNIRGVGQAVDDISVESGVGVYLDGIYIPRAGAAGATLFDLERVEVLRGPQGTLYGRNSAGGAIKYITREADPELGGEVSIEGAEHGTYNAKGYITGPIIEDKLLGKLSLVSLNSDGYMKNIYDGSDGSGVDTQAARLGFKYIISDDVEFTLTGDYQKNDPNPRFFTLVEPGFQSVIHELGGLPPEPASSGFYEVDVDNTGYEKMDTGGVMARLNMAHDNMDSVYLFGLRTSETRFDVDRDHSPVNLFNEAHDENSDWGSAEIQFISNRDGDWSFDGKADWLLGFYYFAEDGKRDVDFYSNVFDEVFFPGALPYPTAELLFHQQIETEAFAVFGEFTYDLTEALRATVGARYTDEKKTFKGRTEINDPTVDYFFPGFPGLVGPGDNGGLIDEIYETEDTTSWSDPTYKFSLEYDFGEESMAYMLFSQGFKSGGYQGTAATAAAATTPFDPENVDNYEMGLKGVFLDQRLQANMAVYYMDYTDLQNGIVTDSGTPETINADAEIKGFEMDLTVLPIEGLRLGGSFGYIDSEYKNFDGSPEREGSQVNGVPKYKYALIGDYFFPLLGGEVTLHADYVWEDDTTDALGASNIPQWDRLNLSVTYLSGEGHWEVIGWVQNATDEEYWLENSIGTAATPPDALPRLVAAPRTYGATINYRFGSQL
jgi:iron complex outermembrane recepter protein